MSGYEQSTRCAISAYVTPLASRSSPRATRASSGRPAQLLARPSSSVRSVVLSLIGWLCMPPDIILSVYLLEATRAFTLPTYRGRRSQGRPWMVRLRGTISPDVDSHWLRLVHTVFQPSLPGLTAAPVKAPITLPAARPSRRTPKISIPMPPPESSRKYDIAGPSIAAPIRAPGIAPLR